MELKVATCQAADEMGLQRQFQYYLTAEPVEAGPFFCESYGVRVAAENDDSASVPNITTSAARIEELLDLLVRNQVGPCSLQEVVEDWL